MASLSLESCAGPVSSAPSGRLGHSRLPIMERGRKTIAIGTSGEGFAC